jgi:hypothetical protein
LIKDWPGKEIRVYQYSIRGQALQEMYVSPGTLETLPEKVWVVVSSWHYPQLAGNEREAWRVFQELYNPVLRKDFSGITVYSCSRKSSNREEPE